MGLSLREEVVGESFAHVNLAYSLGTDMWGTQPDVMSVLMEFCI